MANGLLPGRPFFFPRLAAVYSAFMLTKAIVHSFLLCSILLAASAPKKATLAQKIERTIDASPGASGALWGIQVVDLESGRAVYRRNADKFFVPASNTKLFSTALALKTLGPDHRFVTRALFDGGDLRLVGSGDPNLSGRTLPYTVRDELLNPLAVIEQLADQIAARGIRHVPGNVLGDDSLYPHEPYPPGWGLWDATEYYGAPVSALSVNDNSFKLLLDPGESAGDPARVKIEPAVEYFSILNEVRTVEAGAGSVDAERIPGTRQLILRGTILRGAQPKTLNLAVDDAALYAAFLLHDALERRGVRIDGQPRAAHRFNGQYAPPAGEEVARHESAPLSQIAQVVNKESQNLHAELMLRAAGRAKFGDGSRRNGLRALESMLTEIGVPPKSYDFHDGSGLSRLTLVKPSVITALLTWLWTSPFRDVVLAALPVAGQDGTLQRRFISIKGAEAIHAKTGSLTHVAALGGFALPETGRRYAFSIMVNNYGGSAAEIRAVVDKIAMLLVE